MCSIIETFRIHHLARSAAEHQDLHERITQRPRVVRHLAVRSCIDVHVRGRDCDGFRFDYERAFFARTPIELEKALAEDAAYSDGPINYTIIA